MNVQSGGARLPRYNPMQPILDGQLQLFEPQQPHCIWKSTLQLTADFFVQPAMNKGQAVQSRVHSLSIRLGFKSIGLAATQFGQGHVQTASS